MFSFLIYLIWFFFLYLVPAFILFRINTLTSELIELRGLIITPELNKEKNVKYAGTNFQEFSEQFPKTFKYNIWIKLLKSMCDDAQQGIRHDPNIYIIRCKHIFNMFFGFILLGSFIPLIITEIFSPELTLLFIHTICIFLVFVLYRIFSYRQVKIQGIFYTYWYDKILNFDTSAVNELIPVILNSIENTELPTAINYLAEANQKLADTFIRNTEDMSSKLEEFSKLQKAGEGVTNQNITETLDKNINQISGLGLIYNDIASKIDSSLLHLVNAANTHINEINAVNENTSALYDIKKLFSEYKSEALIAEIKHMQEVTGSFGSTVNNAFTNIEASAKANLDNINNSYNDFDKMCEKLIETLSENNDTKVSEAIKSLNENIIMKYNQFQDQIILLEKSIKEASASTEKIYESFNNFYKLTQSSSFTGRNQPDTGNK